MAMRPVDAREPSLADVVDHPHWTLWLLVLGGLTILALQGFSTPFFQWWVAHINRLPSQRGMAWLFVVCIPIHVFEAVYVHRLARRLALSRSVLGWTVQTLLLGYPSTRLIRRRAGLGGR